MVKIKEHFDFEGWVQLGPLIRIGIRDKKLADIKQVVTEEVYLPKFVYISTSSFHYTYLLVAQPANVHFLQ